MKIAEPHTEVENKAEHRVSNGDPLSGRARIAVKARTNSKEKFNNLIPHLTKELIEECLKDISLRTVPGVDEMTAEQARENLAWLLPPILKQIHEGRYEAPPVKRVYIPKADGTQRPIGIPTVVDRAIQAAMTKILNEVYEQDFLNCSFGFRPGISCHHALATISNSCFKEKLNYALEVDIRDFFGSLKHDWLLKFLEHRVIDKRVIKLVKCWLKAGVLEQGKWQGAENGTPQGGSISPLLANIYLHYTLDLWWEKRVLRNIRGKARLVRYADDFVILFEEHQRAREFLSVLKARLAQFGLEIAEKKTHLTDLSLRDREGQIQRRGIKFLGFTIFRAKTKSGRGTKMVFRTDGKRFTRSKGALKSMLKCNLHWSLRDQQKAINAVLRGHYNYYGMPGNGQRLAAFQLYAIRFWRRALSRRSQNYRFDWDKMHNKILKAYPVVAPSLRINYRDLDRYVRL